MLWIEIIGLLAMQAYDLHSSLAVFQQCHYHIDRYRNWIADAFSIPRVWHRICSFLPFLVLLFIKVEEARSPSVLCFILIYLYVRIQRWKEQSSIFHVRYTARMMRLSSCLLVLVSFVTISVRRSLTYELYLCCIPLLWMLAWVLLPAASYLIFPVERFLQNRYITDAKVRLDSCKHLIRVGISGSYGKTSVKHIAYALIKDTYYTLKTPHSYNNSMGISKTIREELDPLHEVFLCEMGSDHSGELNKLLAFVKPSITMVTAIGPQHLKTFGSQEAIIEEKMSMINDLPKEGVGILNIDNEHIRNYPLHTKAKIVTYGFSSDADIRILSYHLGEDGMHFVLEMDGKCYPFHTQLLGKCNLLNIAGAVAIARLLRVPMAKLQDAVECLPSVEHRLQMTRVGEDLLIDDAYNSNPQGAAAACAVLKEMPGWRVLITPGFAELGEQQEAFSYQFGTQIAQSADEVVLVGNQQVRSIQKGLEDQGYPKNRIHQFSTMKEALHYAKELPAEKKCILIENDIPDIFSH